MMPGEIGSNSPVLPRAGRRLRGFEQNVAGQSVLHQQAVRDFSHRDSSRNAAAIVESHGDPFYDGDRDSDVSPLNRRAPAVYDIGVPFITGSGPTGYEHVLLS